MKHRKKLRKYFIIFLNKDMRSSIMDSMIQTSLLVPGDTKLLWCRIQGCHIRKVRCSGSVIILWLSYSKLSDFLYRDRAIWKSSVKCLCLVFPYCVFSPCSLLCSEHMVLFLWFPGSALHRTARYNIQCLILYGQIPHPNSTFHSLFFTTALPDACPAIVHTRITGTLLMYLMYIWTNWLHIPSQCI